MDLKKKIKLEVERIQKLIDNNQNKNIEEFLTYNGIITEVIPFTTKITVKKPFIFLLKHEKDYLFRRQTI